MESILEGMFDGVARAARNTVSATLIGLAAAGCGDSTGPDGKPGQVQAVISGAVAVTLDCFLKGEGSYYSNQSKGEIAGFAWLVDGMPAGQSPSLTYTFDDAKEWQVVLRALNTAGSVLDADTTNVTVSPPDMATCVSDARIEGRWGVLLPIGSQQVTAHYEVTLPPAIGGAVDGYTWKLSREGGSPVTLGSGAFASSVDVPFSEGGTYVLTVEPSLMGTSGTVAFDVGVRAGEPLAPPGNILIIRTESTGDYSLRFMDGETGFVSEAVFTSNARRIYGGMCASDKIFFSMTDANAAGDMRTDIFSIDIDGTGLTEVVQTAGRARYPDMKHGMVIFSEDDRWNGDEFELVLFDLETRTLQYVSPLAKDVSTIGRSSSFGPSADVFAAGSTYYPAEDATLQKVSVFTRTNGAWSRRRLHEFSTQEAYGWAGEVREGNSGVSWDPQNEFVAYTIDRADGSSALAVARIDGTAVAIRANRADNGVQYSPSGSHILFGRSNPSVLFGSAWSYEVIIIPRSGGPETNLTRATVPANTPINDAPGGYCGG